MKLTQEEFLKYATPRLNYIYECDFDAEDGMDKEAKMVTGILGLLGGARNVAKGAYNTIKNKGLKGTWKALKQQGVGGTWESAKRLGNEGFHETFNKGLVKDLTGSLRTSGAGRILDRNAVRSMTDEARNMSGSVWDTWKAGRGRYKQVKELETALASANAQNISNSLYKGYKSNVATFGKNYAGKGKTGGDLNAYLTNVTNRTNKLTADAIANAERFGGMGTKGIKARNALREAYKEGEITQAELKEGLRQNMRMNSVRSGRALNQYTGAAGPNAVAPGPSTAGKVEAARKLEENVTRSGMPLFLGTAGAGTAAGLGGYLWGSSSGRSEADELYSPALANLISQNMQMRQNNQDVFNRMGNVFTGNVTNV